MNEFIVEKDFESCGYRCVVIKGIACDNGYGGHRCGYVGVPDTHPLWGKCYNDKCNVPKSTATINASDPIGTMIAAMEDSEYLSIGYAAYVHGGVTYSDGDGEYPVEAKDVWWFGFDCNHYSDRDEEGGKSLDFCVGECEKLASFLKQQEVVDE